jgi:glycosyltransferase involved in cell wall biosynthesis
MKQCRSLAAAGYTIVLIAADGSQSRVESGVHIVDVGKARGRLRRMLCSTWRVLRAALKLNADLYHFHDPELIPAGLVLRLFGKRVIFDAHEDVPKQLLSKPYLGPRRLELIAKMYSVFEWIGCRAFNGVVTATPSIGAKFQKINKHTVVVNNFPLPFELDAAIPWQKKNAEVCYVGGIGRIRGILEVVNAMSLTQSHVRLNLVGRFSEPSVEQQSKLSPGWNHVTEHGFVDRKGVREIMGRSLAGLVTFHPVPNHIDAQPNKMFEYMSAGIPVIGSNFPLWRDILEASECGVCVDPLDPAAIARAIDHLAANPAEAKRLGENGRRAIMEKYNWPAEEKKLLSLYETVLAQ